MPGKKNTLDYFDAATVTKIKKKFFDNFVRFRNRPQDNHDLLHNGFIATTVAVANMKTQLASGGSGGGVLVPVWPFHKSRRSTSFELPRCRISRCGARQNSRRASTLLLSGNTRGFTRHPTDRLEDKIRHVPSCTALHSGGSHSLRRGCEPQRAGVCMGAGPYGGIAFSASCIQQRAWM